MKISKKARCKPDGNLLIKVAGAVAGFTYKDGICTVIPLRIAGTYPFIIKPNPISAGNAYYLFEHVPPIYVNQKVVIAHPSEICEARFLGTFTEMALPK